MKNNEELKKQAWARLWEDRWFGRLFGGGLLLGLCGYAVQAVLGGVLRQLNVQSWSDYAEALIRNRQDLTTPVPNLTQEFISQATSSTVLSMFFSYIMAGIAAYGTAVILRKCLANDEHGWLREAFGGFRDPFGMLWLFFRMMLIWIGWGLFLVLPPLGLALLIVAFYRYRFVWLVKAEHPDWSAGRCLKACRELMAGHKMESFRLDCSYWKPLTGLMLLAGGCSISALCALLNYETNGLLAIVLGFVSFVSLVALFPCAIVVTQYLHVGQGLLYEEIRQSEGRMADR